MSSSGYLVILNRLGRELKYYSLDRGYVTLGSHADCDIRFVTSAVRPHHATVSVHSSQALVRSLSDSKTLLNGVPVSVSGLRHRDIIKVGNREVRWEYCFPEIDRPLDLNPVLQRRKQKMRTLRRGSEPPRRDAFVAQIRASMPAALNGKQVAVVQPQPRDLTTDGSDASAAAAAVAAVITAGPGTGTPRGSVTYRWRSSRANPGGAPSNRSTTYYDTRRDGVIFIIDSEMRCSPVGSDDLDRRASGNRRVRARRLPATPIDRPRRMPATQFGHASRTPAASVDRTRRAPPSSADHVGRTPATPPDHARRTPATPPSNARRAPATPPDHARRAPATPPDHARRTPATPPSNARRAPATPPDHARSAPATPVDHVRRAHATPTNSADRTRRAHGSADHVSRAPATPADAADRSDSHSATTDNARGSCDETVDNVRREAANSTDHAGRAHTDSVDRMRRSLADTAANARRNEPNLANTTKATLWIESRKSSPRKTPKSSPVKTPNKTPVPRKNVRKTVSAKKGTPLRTTVLRKAQSAHKIRVTKIQAPLKMDSTKQAAINLMTRHTSKSKQPSPNKRNKGPSYVVKKLGPVNTPKRTRSSGTRTSYVSPANNSGHGHSDPSTSYGASGSRQPSKIEVTESQSSMGETSMLRRSGRSSAQSSHLSNTKKSVLKHPNTRRTDSMKFDESNLDKTSHNRSSDVVVPEETDASHTNNTGTDMSLRYSDSSKSPSPRKSIHSRSNRMLESTAGTSFDTLPNLSRKTLTPRTPRSRQSLRNSVLEALRKSKNVTDVSTYSRRTTKSLTDQSYITTITPARQMRTRSPIASRSNLESYSIVDLVSDSNDSIYNSADSLNSTAFNTPGNQPNHVLHNNTVPGLSTPPNNTREYKMAGSLARTAKHKERNSYQRGVNININVTVTTPENTQDASKNIKLNSTKLTRASKTRLQISNQSDILIVDGPEHDSSPKSSRRISKPSEVSPSILNNISVCDTLTNTPATNNGDHTPENQHSPIEASTPVLNIQSLLDASLNSKRSPISGSTRKSNRKTIGALRSESRKGRTGLKSKSLTLLKPVKGRDISKNFDDSYDIIQNDEEEVITPRSAAKPVPEGVKNKHSSAKKPLSKRSLIDNLNESDIVKQLFNSPVKRKLSQSMTEFSRRHLFDDEPRPWRPTRATIAVAGRSTDTSILNNTEQFTPDVFVSPLNTPSNSPNITGIKSILQKNTPNNDLQSVKGVQDLLRTPRTRNSNMSAVKFAKSPRALLSDSMFDQLLGRPPIRAVYTKSKSFTTTSKVQKRGKNRKSKTKSLHDVSDQTTNNVEEWLQEKLKEQLHKNGPGEASTFKGRKSLNKSNNSSKTYLMRELSMLKTDTVNGSDPLIINRTRNSSILHQSDKTSQKKSASELYSSHTLPIKKRSFVEASINKSSNDKSHKLPIKKRAVVHSTPVNGRVNINMTMNASEIGRMSPISSRSKPAETDSIIRPQAHVSPRRKSSPVKSVTPVATSKKDKPVEIAKLSPKKTRSVKAAQSSPAIVRTRRGRKSKIENQEVLNVKRRRSSIVITKKAPLLSLKSKQVNSPKVTRRGKTKLHERQETPKISPKKTRSTTRGQKSQVNVDVKATPKKNTRAKVRRSSVIISKQSPKLNPRATKNTKDKIVVSQPDVESQTKRTSKSTTTGTELKDKNNRNKRTPKGNQVEIPSKRRTRKTVTVSEHTVDRTAVEKSQSTIQTRRTRKIVVETAQAEKANENTKAQNKRTRKVTQNKSAEQSESGLLKSIEAQASVVLVTRRGRITKIDDIVPESNKSKSRKKPVKEPEPKKSLAKRANAVTTVIKQTRGRKTKLDIPPEDTNPVTEELPTGRGRKRKINEREDFLTKDKAEKKYTRSTRAAAKEVVNTTNIGKASTSRRGAGDVGDDKKQKVSKTVLAETVAKTRSAPARGRKATSAAVSSPPAGGRNKRSKMEISDTKENNEPAKRARRAVATPKGPVLRATLPTATASAAARSRARRR